MRSVTPLPAHPELKIIHGRAWTEYRVQSSRARGSTNSSLKWLQCFWIDAVVCLCVAIIWPLVCGSSFYLIRADVSSYIRLQRARSPVLLHFCSMDTVDVPKCYGVGDTTLSLD